MQHFVVDLCEALLIYVFFKFAGFMEFVWKHLTKHLSFKKPICRGTAHGA